MANITVQHSQGLPEQLIQRQNELLRKAANQDQHKVIKAMYTGLPIKDCNQPLKDILELVKEFRILMGAIRDVDAKQVQTEAIHILRNFSFFTIAEIKLGFSYFTAGRLLPVDKFTGYLNFSSIFITQVLSNYANFRANILKEVESNGADNPLSTLPPAKLSLEERKGNMVYFVSMVYEQIKAELDYVVLLHPVYRYFLRTGKLAPTPADRERAKEYASTKLNRLSIKEARSIHEIMKGVYRDQSERDSLMRVYGYEYHVKKYFEGKKLKDITSMIDEAEFEKL